MTTMYGNDAAPDVDQPIPASSPQFPTAAASPVLRLPDSAADDLGALVIRLDDIVIWRTTLAALHAAAPAPGRHEAVLDLSDDAAGSRLESAARLLLLRDGPAFFATRYTLALYDAFADSALLDSVDLSGSELLRFAEGAAATMLPAEPASDSGTQVIAFYLPQFHPFAENDSWWGDGFTEWSNVLSAQPQYPGHVMPILPADLGCYDLRLPQVRARQAGLAAEYGIDGFCYYFYWFSGRRLMESVLEDILHSGVPATRFCLCWANETWSRRWDGGHEDVLMEQPHDAATDATLIADALPYFADPRYITIDGAPVFLVYRIGIMNDPARVFAAWKQAAREAGYPGLFIVAARTFQLDSTLAALADAVVDFPPHGTMAPVINETVALQPGFVGRVFDYREIVVDALAATPIHPVSFPGVMPRWDNSPRTGKRANIFAHSTPDAFRLWLRFALDIASCQKPRRRFVFINSWNEWGEGAMLEPDRRHGRAYLEALRQARGGYSVAPTVAQRFAVISDLPAEAATAWLTGFGQDARMVGQMLQRLHGFGLQEVPSGPPAFISRLGAPPRQDGNATFDWTSLGQDHDRLIWSGSETAAFEGWAVFGREAPHPADRVAYLLIIDLDSGQTAYHLVIHEWSRREDVAQHFGMHHPAELQYLGFRLTLPAGSVAPGHYALTFVQMVEGVAITTTRAATLVRL